MRDNKPDKLARFVVFFRASLLGMLLWGVVADAGAIFCVRFIKGNKQPKRRRPPSWTPLIKSRPC